MAKEKTLVVLPTLEEVLSGELNEAQKQLAVVLEAYKKKNPLKYAVKEKEYVTKLLKLA